MKKKKKKKAAAKPKAVKRKSKPKRKGKLTLEALAVQMEGIRRTTIAVVEASTNRMLSAIDALDARNAEELPSFTPVPHDG